MRKLIPFIIAGLFFGLSFSCQAAVPNLIVIQERAAAPVTPATAHYCIYALSADGKLYGMGDDKTAHDLESGGASTMELDLDNDAATESTALGAIATTGDTYDIFTEPSADKLLITVTRPWPVSVALSEGSTSVTAGEFMKKSTYDANNDGVVDSGPDTRTEMLWSWPAEAMNVASFETPELDIDTSSWSQGQIWVMKFDDSNDKSVWLTERLPNDISSGATVYFEVLGYAETASAKRVVFDVMARAATAGATWDTAWVSVSSTGQTVSAVQDTIDKFTYSETVSNLGWYNKLWCQIRLRRDADSGNDDFSGDFSVLMFSVYTRRELYSQNP